MGETGGELTVEVVVQSASAVDQRVADEVGAIVEAHFGRPCRVVVVTHLVTASGWVPPLAAWRRPR